MGVMEQHNKLRHLVVNHILIPGIFNKEDGMIIYDPISVEDYECRIENQNVMNVAYHTLSMRRGIFTVGNDSEIINYKGVDSKAIVEDIKTCDITKVLDRKQDRHEIVVTYFEHGSYSGHIKDPQIRVKGASQLHDLITEREKLEKYQGNPLIKLPRITDVKAFSLEFCLRYNLPLQVKVSEDFIKRLEILDKEDERRGIVGKSRLHCLEQMKKTGMPADTRNQTWSEYFSSLSNEEQLMIQNIPGVQIATLEEDRRYGLGAIFGQTTRILESPFRISDLAFYIENKETESVKAILDYSQAQYEEDYLLYYAATMGRNVAGFMNEGLANHLWAHRQDFALSAEICDEAFNDVSLNLTKEDCSEYYKHFKSIIENNAKQDLETLKEDMNKYELYRCIMTDKVKYYSQIYLFASNMKVIEDAYKLVGYEIQEKYLDRFIDEFINCLENKKVILEAILLWGDKLFGEFGQLELYLGKRAQNTIERYEQYIEHFKEKTQGRFYDLINQ